MVTLLTIHIGLVDSDIGHVHFCLLPSIILANHCTVDPVGHPHANVHVHVVLDNTSDRLQVEVALRSVDEDKIDSLSVGQTKIHRLSSLTTLSTLSKLSTFSTLSRSLTISQSGKPRYTGCQYCQNCQYFQHFRHYHHWQDFQHYHHWQHCRHYHHWQHWQHFQNC